MTLTEALARHMFANEHTDAAPGAIDEAWTTDPDLRAFWTERSTSSIRFMAEWRVRARTAALPPTD